jgi:hypothetical protein
VAWHVAAWYDMACYGKALVHVVCGGVYIYIYVCSAWFLNVCIHIFSVRTKALTFLCHFV